MKADTTHQKHCRHCRHRVCLETSQVQDMAKDKDMTRVGVNKRQTKWWEGFR